MPGITRKSVEIFKMCFCDVKILIASGTPIRVIFQNSVTNADCVQTLESLDCFLSLPACNRATRMVTPLCPELCPEVEQMIAENCGDSFFVNNTVDFPSAY